MKCPRCQHDNPSHAKFCLECGVPLGSTSESGPSGAPHAELQRALTEAVQQQTATSEILRVISSSPTDYQPVFETIVRNAARLCQATSSLIWLLEGDRFRVVAPYSVPPESPSEIGVADAPNLFRVIHDGTTHHIGDIESDPRVTPGALNITQAMGARAVLQVPMVRDREVIGALTVLRDTPGMFASGKVELLKTFADQAVIAIENVRLFNETKEALEQQTATAEILGVISSSPTDVQPVFDAVAESAARLCRAFDSAIFRRDGDRLLLVAHHGPIPVARTLPLIGTVNGRAVLDGRTVHILDLHDEADEFPVGSALTREEGVHTHLSVPLMREGVAIGTINLRRTERQLFSDRQVALLQTFADQAVIAIENVRLFTETKEALERQTATSEILQVISSSPTDVQPVFDAIAKSAARLCEAFDAVVYRVDGDVLHPVAHSGSFTRGPVPLVPGTINGRAVIERRLIHVVDAQAAADEFPEGAALSRQEGTRSLVSVPLLRTGNAIATIGVRRFEVRPFSDNQIALLQTFADQAVIAIENVRLFKELEARNRDLTTALDTQTATSDILSGISRSQTDVQPVFDAIVPAPSACWARTPAC